MFEVKNIFTFVWIVIYIYIEIDQICNYWNIEQGKAKEGTKEQREKTRQLYAMAEKKNSKGELYN